MTKTFAIGDRVSVRTSTASGYRPIIGIVESIERMQFQDVTLLVIYFPTEGFWQGYEPRFVTAVEEDI